MSRPARLDDAPTAEYDAPRVKRIGGILLIALTALSLLLLVPTVVLWVRSYWIWEDVYVRHPPVYTRRWAWSYLGEIRSTGGQVFVATVTPSRPLPDEEFRRMTADGGPDVTYERVEQPANRPDLMIWHLSPAWRAIGIDYESYRNDSRLVAYTIRRLAVPYWLLAVVLGLLPSARLFAVWRRRRRVGHGLCPTCGYDLRATPTRCPECGTVSSNVRAAPDAP
jgi:hypothetical protein